MLFKTVFVFDRAQVAPIDGVELPRWSRGVGRGRTFARASGRADAAFAESLGFSVSFEPIAGPVGGWCDQKVGRRTPATR